MAALIYALSFKGHASPTLCAAFADFEVEAADGATWVRCARDQLRSLIALVQDLGLELLEVRMLAEPDMPGPQPAGRLGASGAIR